MNTDEKVTLATSLKHPETRTNALVLRDFIVRYPFKRCEFIQYPFFPPINTKWHIPLKSIKSFLGFGRNMRFYFESCVRHSDVVKGSSSIKKYPALPFWANLLLRGFFRGVGFGFGFGLGLFLWLSIIFFGFRSCPWFWSQFFGIGRSVK